MRVLFGLLPVVLLALQLYILWKPTDLIDGPRRILFICPISLSEIPRFLSSVPTSWQMEVNTYGRLVFVVGGSFLQLSAPSSAYGLLTLAGVRDGEYPPHGKELEVFPALLATGLDAYEFVFKFDSDTFFEPSRLVRLIESLHLSGSSQLYMGSPLHHCQCRPQPSQPCTRDLGTLYCSGAAVLLSILTVKTFARYVPDCRRKGEGGTLACNSSDSRLGWCLNKFLGIECTSAQDPTLGQSWAEPDRNGVKIRKEHHFCQELTSQGGVRYRHVRPRPYVFTKMDFLYCVIFHPLKSVEDMRYVSWNVFHVENRTAEFLPRQDCLLHLGVFTAPEDIIPRMVIRESWGKLAKALGVPVTFVTANKVLPPHMQLLLSTEGAVFNDVIRFDSFDDSYYNLFEKTLAWFSWASTHSQCAFVMKMDQDSYPRLSVLLNSLHSIPSGAHCIGTMWGSFDAKKRNATVIHNKDSPWYLADQYPHPVFPPYMSGGAYILSRNLVNLVSISSPSTMVYRLEDAGLGILVAKLGFAKVTYTSGEGWDVERCVVDSTYDNPAYSAQFNMYGRFAADMNGSFCEVAVRKPILPAGTRSDNNRGIWDAPA